jgi:hypothetical protein
MHDKPDSSLRAPVDALTLPVENIRWKGDDPRPKTKKRIATAATAAFVLGVATMADAAPDAPRLAPPGCIFHTVVKGDNTWRIAGRAGVTLDVVARLNPQIADLSKIEVGDQIATSCPANEVQRATLAPAVHVVNVDRWLTERDAPNVASKRAILAALYKAGARDDQLITLAAITEGESGRKITAVGDIDIQTGSWGPSGGAFQVRSLKAERGKGTTRDLDRVLTLEGGARSAVELWDQSVARGKPGWQPWTAAIKGWHVPHLPAYTATAAEMGL